MATGKFVFTFSERELSIIEEALETCAKFGGTSETFNTTDYRDMSDSIGERLAY